MRLQRATCEVLYDGYCWCYRESKNIEYYLQKNGYDVDATIYELLIIKAEDSTITVSGMTTDDTSGYFRRLASRYKRFNSGILIGG